MSISDNNTDRLTRKPIGYSLGRREKSPWRKSRAELLAEVEPLPDDAWITDAHAAAIIDTTRGNLANMRYHKRGPPFVRGRRFIRYQKGACKAFNADRVVQTTG
jgi:hypothetical protein